jgi:hypothetical protein
MKAAGNSQVPHLAERAWASMMHCVMLAFAAQLVKRSGVAAPRDAALAPPRQLRSLLCWQNNPSGPFVVISTFLCPKKTLGGRWAVVAILSRKVEATDSRTKCSRLSITLHTTFSVAHPACLACGPINVAIHIDQSRAHSTPSMTLPTCLNHALLC